MSERKRPKQIPTEQGEEIVFDSDDDYLTTLEKFMLLEDVDFWASRKTLEEYMARVEMWMNAWEEAKMLKFVGVTWN